MAVEAPQEQTPLTALNATGATREAHRAMTSHQRQIQLVVLT